VILLVRHGRTTDNAAGRLLGRADPPLDDAGVAQAAALAGLAKAWPGPVRVVSSPLRRCRETAARIAEAAGTSVEVDERWIELDYGELEAMPLADVPVETWARWRSDLDFRPPGGETLAELGRRVRAACDELAAGGEGEDIVVVTHVSPIKAAVAWALGVDDSVTWRLFVAPGSVSRIAVAGGRTPLHGFNDTSAQVGSD
jgi:broad specificity phosphatase PhoE